MILVSRRKSSRPFKRCVICASRAYHNQFLRFGLGDLDPVVATPPPATSRINQRSHKRDEIAAASDRDSGGAGGLEPAVATPMLTPVDFNNAKMLNAEQIWEVSKSLEAVFVGDECEAVHRIREIKLRDRQVWIRSKQGKYVVQADEGRDRQEGNKSH
ncbi:hypothetical protein Ancab_016519 [Ancistrocladus abbreviatus]